MKMERTVSDNILEQMIDAFEDGANGNGTQLDNRCCDDVLLALKELSMYRECIRKHQEKKKIA